jgi:predicted membrane protein
MLVKSDGHVDHVRLVLLLLAMSTGFIRGVGYIPRHRFWRWLFAAPTALAWLLLAVWW